jgi:hypothetical protein
MAASTACDLQDCWSESPISRRWQPRSVSVTRQRALGDSIGLVISQRTPESPDEASHPTGGERTTSHAFSGVWRLTGRCSRRSRAALCEHSRIAFAASQLNARVVRPHSNLGVAPPSSCLNESLTRWTPRPRISAYKIRACSRFHASASSSRLAHASRSRSQSWSFPPTSFGQMPHLNGTSQACASSQVPHMPQMTGTTCERFRQQS